MFGKNPKRPPETGDGSKLNIVEIFPTLQGEGPFVGQPSVFVRLGGCNLACGFCDTEFEEFEEMGLDSLVNQVVKLATEGAANSASPLAGEATRLAPHHTSPLKGEVGGGLSRSGEGASPLEHNFTAPPSQPSPARGEGARAAPLVPNNYTRDLVVITGGEPLRQNIVPLCEALLAKGLRVQIETNGTLWRPLPEGVNVVCSPKVTDGKYHALRPDLLARVDALKFIISAGEAEYREIGQVGQSGNEIPIYLQPMDEYDPSKNAANLARALTLAQTHGYRLSMQMHKLWGVA